MYNYTITRLSYLPIFVMFFAGGICTGGLGGIVIGILEKDMVGILGGTFFGFVAGVMSGLASLIFTFVFNTIAPLFGGLKLRLEAAPTELPKTTPSPEPPASTDP